MDFNLAPNVLQGLSRTTRKTMRAVCIPKPGSIEHISLPVPQPQPRQLLLRVRAVGVCMSDLEILAGTRPAPYIKYPITPGHEWCGEVVALGADTSGFSVGDRVVVEGHNFCGQCYFCQRGQTNLCEHYNEFGFTLDGAYAEYVAVRQDLAHRFGKNLPFEVAALTEPAACAGHGMLRGEVQPGDTVCIIGPGTIGLLGVAWARSLGAAQIAVIGVDRANEALARAVGATHYFVTGEDTTQALRGITGGRGADVLFESAGATRAVSMAFEMTRRGGSVVLMGIAGGAKPLGPTESDMFALKDLHVHGIFAYSSKIFARTLKMLESGELAVAALITHRMSLTTVSAAFDLMRDKREPVAKIILTPDP